MAHTFSCLLAHIIFSTKEREPWINPEIQDRLHSYIAGIVNDEFGHVRCIGGVEDHVHILADLKTRFSPADILRTIKANSSRWIHRTFTGYDDFAWQTGYGIFSVSESAAASVVNYIENQPEHHRAITFQEEFISFLKKHRIAYDPKYIWE